MYGIGYTWKKDVGSRIWPRAYAKSVLGRGSRCFAHPANTLVRKRLTTVFTGWLCAPARFPVTDGSRCACACHMPPPQLCRSHLWCTFNYVTFIQAGLKFRFLFGHTHFFTFDLKLIEKITVILLWHLV